jgi:hypothetical protein
MLTFALARVIATLLGSINHLYFWYILRDKRRAGAWFKNVVAIVYQELSLIMVSTLTNADANKIFEINDKQAKETHKRCVKGTQRTRILSRLEISHSLICFHFIFHSSTSNFLPILSSSFDQVFIFLQPALVRVQPPREIAWRIFELNPRSTDCT